MSDHKTTREILEKKTPKAESIPLYNPKALDKIKADFDNWLKTVVSEKDRANWQVTPRSILGSELPRELLYSPLSSPQLDYSAGLAFPGEEPFTRGIHPNMYRGRAFTMRQLCGAGSPEYINQRLKMLLEHGATGLNLILDLATIQMFDSDEPEALGQVGTVGVPIDWAGDMEDIFKGIPIDRISTSIVSHYPRNTAIVLPFYLVMAERRNIPWGKLAGSVQNDFIMENLVRGGCEYIPPGDAFRIQCDNIEFLRKEVPRWNTVTLNGYNVRDFGTSAITEMAVALANGIAIIEEMSRRGHDADFAAARLAFFWSVSNDFFEEVARLRAVRRLWYRIMKHRFGAKDPRSMWMRCHVQTSGSSLTREEPMVNVVRAAYQALAAVLGGCQSLHVDSYDEAYSVPSEESSILALRTQQVIEVETQVSQVVDPLGGSFYVETLTDQIEDKILDELAEIEVRGGIVEVVSSGWLHQKISRYIERQQRMVADGDIKVVGRNYYRAAEPKMPDIEVHHYDDAVGRRMRDGLAGLRRHRDNRQVTSCLGALKKACKKGGNVMAACVDCARAGVTEGEMRRAFAEALGQWQSPIYV
ncbi:MAG: acyl-CoA mutase large subunit family protein [Dehalococcoidales bacterium]